MKHQLLKPWDWRDVPIVYGACLEWIKDQYDFPFYWYRQIDNKIELVKQLSRNCGVVQDSNEWIPSQITLAKPETISPVEEMYLDRRSWLTLGEVPYDPLDQLSTFTWGNKKVQLSYTTDGQLFSRKEWVNDQIVYSSAISYNRKKDRFFASHYKNSDGVEAQKIDKGWNYLAGKPIIEKQYGKHK
jgi:hypothetical protein